MTINTFPKLKKPPIKEVVLGIGYLNHLTDKDELERFCNIFKDSFPDKRPILNTQFNLAVQTGNVETKTQVEGFSLSNKENKESLIIDFNRITFVDRNKYVSFDNFYGNFRKIFREAESFKKISFPRDIGLKFSNQFALNQEEIQQNKISFFPSIKAKLSEENHIFAGWSQTSSSYLLQSTDYPELQGLVSTNLQFIGVPVRLQTTLIIDTKINITEINESLLEQHVRKMQKFKNQIFFANIQADIKDFM